MNAMRTELAERLRVVEDDFADMFAMYSMFLTRDEHRLMALARSAAEEAAAYLAREPVSAIEAQ